MSDSLSYALKLDRAREHLDFLDQQTRAWVEREPYRIVSQPDPETPLATARGWSYWNASHRESCCQRPA